MRNYFKQPRGNFEIYRFKICGFTGGLAQQPDKTNIIVMATGELNLNDVVRMLNTDEKYKGIHKIYSIEGGWIYLSDRFARRYKITPATSWHTVYELIDKVQKAKYNSFFDKD